MTATIDPGPESTVPRRDPLLRQEDYLTALQFWLSYPDERIVGVVLCDNSGYDLTDLRAACAAIRPKRPVEILGFAGNHHPVPMHYGYGELGIIDHALEQSHLLASAKFFVKASGRLRFPGLSTLLNTLDDEVLTAVDCRRAYKAEGPPAIRARTQLMLFDSQFYRRRFLKRREEMFGLCTHIEEFFAIELRKWQGQPGIVLRWKVECPPLGISASDNASYDRIERRVKGTVRSVLRRIAPTVWI